MILCDLNASANWITKVRLNHGGKYANQKWKRVIHVWYELEDEFLINFYEIHFMRYFVLIINCNYDYYEEKSFSHGKSALQ